MKKTLLLLILAIGLALRVIGADWGFPMLLHPDEHIVAGVPADMAKRASCDPAIYARPDHVEIYANAALYQLASFIKHGKPLADTFESDKTFYYLLSRVLVALLGTACIAVAFLIGREYSEGAGVIAALLFAVFPPYVGHSHYITSDIPLTLCILCSIFFAVRYLKRPSDANLMLLSLSSAVAVSVKYPGALTVLMTITVVVYRNYGDRRKLLTVLSKACLAFLLSVFVVSPYLFLNYQKAISALLHEARTTHYGAEGLGWAGNMLYYAKSYFSFSGMLMLPFFLAGVFYVIKNEREYSLPLFFGLLYWLLLSKVPLHWERWALPMFTAPLLITAYGADALYRRYLPQRRRIVAAACIVALLLITGRLLIVSSVVTATFTLEDTRNVSSEFMEAAAIDEENALYEGYTPLSPGSPRLLFREGDSLDDKTYVVLSSYTYNRFLKDRRRYTRQTKFYHRLFSLPLVKEFTPVSDTNFADLSFWANKSPLKGIFFLMDYFQGNGTLLRGPTIRIYCLNE